MRAWGGEKFVEATDLQVCICVAAYVVAGAIWPFLGNPIEILQVRFSSGPPTTSLCVGGMHSGRCCFGGAARR
jgi:hypothetical protein